jgi:serine/threonine-protein kinase
MSRLSPPEIERRALALFEHLADQPHNTKLRQRLLKNETEPVVARVRALEASLSRATGALPTLIPGSADCEGALPPPARVGAFRLERRIGRGGMGDVWAGQRDDGLYDQKVAIKLIQRHALARAAAAFDDERRFLARLTHPNIARLIDGGVTEDGLPWLVIEYVEGQHIDDACANRPIAERVNLFIKAVDAVQYAHGQMVAHADLKPSNILVDREGRVRLLDFGIAGLIGAEGGSPTGSGPLTREFASPERLAGGGPSVSDDVFALGKTLSHVLEGSADVELTAIVAKASASEIATRYGSAAALIADLDRWRARLPVTAMPDGWRYKATKFTSRHRGGVVATGLAFLLLSATAIVATSNYLRAERARNNAANRSHDAHGAANYLMFTLMDRLAQQPGSLKLQATVGATAQTYLDRLAAAPDSPPEVRADTAAGLLRLGELMGATSAPSLADFNQARHNVDRAANILMELLATQPHAPVLLAKYGQTRAMQCRLQIYGDHNAGKALDYAQNGIARLAPEPSSPEVEYALWTLRICAGDALVWREQTAAAIQLLSGELTKAYQRQKVAPQFGDEVMIARNLRFLGEAYFYAHRLPESLSAHREALAILDRRRAKYPNDQSDLTNYVSIADDLASTYSNLHQPRKGLVVARKGYEATLRAVEADPSDLGSRRRGLSIARTVAVMEAQTGQSAAAMALMAKVDTAWHDLLRQFPNDAALFRLYLMSLRPHGDIYRLAGDVQRACVFYRVAQTGWSYFDHRWGISASDRAEDVGYIARDILACSGQGTFADE